MTAALRVDSVRETFKRDAYVRITSGVYKGDLANVVDVLGGGTRLIIRYLPRLDFAAISSSSAAGGASSSSTAQRYSAMSWADAESGQRKVLAVRRDPVTGDTTMTEEQTVERAHYTGSPAEKRFMERRWCERLRQAMLRVDKRKRSASVRAVERAAKRQCKKDERQTEALLAGMRNWTAHMFDQKCAVSVTCKAALVEECLSEARALARSRGEKLPWLECLPKGICESERLASFLRRWAERGAKTGEFMVEREAEHEDEISTDDEE
jgi:hypothetical protein